MTQQSCDECGAVIESVEKHADWHAAEKDRVQQVVNDTLRRTGAGG